MEHPTQRTQRIIAFFLGVIVVFALVGVLKIAQSVLLPLFIAILLSFIVEPIITFLEKIKIPRIVAIIIVILMFVGVFYLVGLFVYSSARSFVREFPKYQDRFILLTAEISERYLAQFDLSTESILRDINWGRTLQNTLVSWSSGVMSFLGNLMIIVLFMIFLLLEKSIFQRKLKLAFDNKTSSKIAEILSHTNAQIARYLSVKLFVSLLTGVLVYVTMKFIGLDFPLIWGSAAFLLNFIPNIGSAIVIVVVMLMGFIQFYPSWGRIVAVAVSVNLIQFSIGNFLDPRLSGQRLNLSPFFIIVSLIIWGWVWGVVGMFLSVPITVVIKIVCENIPSLRPIGIFMGSGKSKLPDYPPEEEVSQDT